jgi:hypothetical protein
LSGSRRQNVYRPTDGVYLHRAIALTGGELQAASRTKLRTLGLIIGNAIVNATAYIGAQVKPGVNICR